MAEFAPRLQGMAPELSWPVLDAKGIEGRWDLTLTFTWDFLTIAAIGAMAAGRGDAAALGGDLAPATDPTGGITIFQTIEKQLGLKLEMRKRLLPVTVVDHREQKPSEN